MTRTYQAFLWSCLEQPFDTLSRLAEGGRPLMGYLCSYVPEELIQAAGFHPVRLFGRARRMDVADQYLQPYACAHIRGILDDFLSGRYPPMAGVVFAHTCDTMQSFFDVFRKHHPELFVHVVNFPAKLSGETALRYAIQEFRRFQSALEAWTGQPVEAGKLREAIQVHNRTRALLDDLYARHAGAPDRIASATVLSSVLAAMTEDKETFNEQLAGFLRAHRGAGSARDDGRVRLIVAGSLVVDPAIYERIDDLGATVVDDDLCTGRRYFSGLVRGSNLACLTRRYFERRNCPAKHYSLNARAHILLDAARRHRAEGVLFLHLKFCDPHAFDYPYLRDALEAEGVPTQLIEVEHTGAVDGRLETRLEAFVEQLLESR